MKFVFLEGVDGTGKTTLFNKVKGLFGESEYFTFPSHPINEDISFYLDLKKDHTNKVCMMDRSFVTDLTYRLTDNEEPSFTLSEMENFCRDNAVYVIYCNNENSYQKAMERGDDNIPDENTHKLRQFMYTISLNIFKTYGNVQILSYDYEKDEFNNIVLFLLKLIEEPKKEEPKKDE